MQMCLAIVHALLLHISQMMFFVLGDFQTYCHDSANSGWGVECLSSATMSRALSIGLPDCGLQPQSLLSARDSNMSSSI